MMKKLLLLIAFFVSIQLNAQVLESKIPNDVDAIITVDGDQIFDLIAQSDIENLDLFKGSGFKLSELGIDFESKAHYFFQNEKDGMYHNFLIKLKDQKAFEAYLTKNRMEIDKSKLIHSIEQDKMMASWVNGTLLITTMTLSTNDAQSMNPYTESDDYAVEAEPAYEEEPVMEIQEVEMVEEIQEDRPVMYDQEVKEAIQEVEVEVEHTIDAPEQEYAVEEEIVEDYSYNNPYNEDYYQKLEAKRIAEAKMAQDFISKKTTDLLGSNVKNSILANKSYQSGKSKKSSAYVWVKNYSSLLSEIMSTQLPSSMMGMSGMGMPDYTGLGLESLQANLMFEEDQIKVVYDMYMSDAQKDMYKKIYNGGLDKKFLNYMDQNNMIAYFSLASNTQALLEEYPAIMSNIYGAMVPQMSDELNVGLDLISVMLDEEAIGELITGDALFVLNNIGEKEVTYTSYDYNENFEAIETTKTKMEIVPDFTFMLGSKNKELVTKILNLTTKHRLAENTNNYFKMNKMGKMPFDLFVVMKNDILFLTNSESEVNKIARNRFNANLGKHKSFLKKNVSTIYMNSEALINQFPKEMIPASQMEKVLYLKDNVTEMYFNSSKLKKNRFRSEQIIKTSKNSENSLKFMLDMIQQMTARPTSTF